MRVVVGLGRVDDLGGVDATVARPDVGHAAGQPQVDAVLRAEQLDAHDRAGERRVGRAGEDGHEAQRRRQEPPALLLLGALPVWWWMRVSRGFMMVSP